MGPRCSSAETQVCHRSYIIAATLDPMEKNVSKRFFSETTGQLKPNCPGMIIGRSSVFYADRKSKMAATTGHSIIDANLYDFYVIVTNFGPKLRCCGQHFTCYGFPIIAVPEPFSIYQYHPSTQKNSTSYGTTNGTIPAEK